MPLAPATHGTGTSAHHADAADRTTRFTFNEDGQKLTETFAYGTGDAATTTFAYTDGELTSLTDPKGNETTWAYTSTTVTMTDPMNNSEVKTYSGSRLISILTRNDTLRTFEYDADGRLETETWYDGPTDGDDVVETFTWTYTAAGQVASAANSAGAYTFEYDDFGQVIYVTQPFGVTQTFAYDSYGHRILVLDSLGGREESLYDGSGNLVTRILTQGGDTLRIDQTFDAYGRVLTQKRTSNAAGTTLVGTSAYTYGVAGEIASIVHKDSSSATLSEFTYTWEDGQLTSRTDTQTGIDSGTPWTLNYTFDGQGQLTGDGTNTYDYDVGGNRDTGYTYVRNDADDADTNLLQSDGTWAYSYDGEGNITKKSLGADDETWIYEFDHANHLISAQKWTEDPTSEYYGTAVLQMEAEYRYDVFGNRIEKSVDDDGVGGNDAVILKMALDGWNPAKTTPVGLENFDVWADLDYASSLTTRYMRGDVVDQVWARIDLSDPYWYLTDHLGSVRDVIDETGDLAKSVVYDSFGNITDQTGAGDLGRYAWTGREFDVETELQFNRARYYDGKTGRWISQDPLGFDAGDSNLYRYAKNWPILARDPSGLDPFWSHEFWDDRAGRLATEMKGQGRWSADLFYIYGLATPAYHTIGTQYDPLYGFIPFWVSNIRETDTAGLYKKGCFGLVNIRLGSDVYNPNHFFFTDVNDAIKKAQNVGNSARIAAIQSDDIIMNRMTPTAQKRDGKEVYASRITTPERDSSGNHATWVQSGTGFWEFLGPTGWGGDFFTGARKRFVSHQRMLPAGYKVTIYVVAKDPTSKFLPAANGPLTPTGVAN